MAARFEQVITGAGATYTIPISTVRGQDVVVFINPDGGCNLAADITFQYDEAPANGVIVTYYWGESIVGGAFAIILDATYNTINVVDPFLEQAQGVQLTHLSQSATGTDGVGVAWLIALEPDTLNASILEDASITLAKFPAQTRGYIIVGDATGRPALLDANGNAQILIGDGTDLASVAVTGDIAITSGGVTSISAGAIVNADVNASAAIAYSKLAALSSGNILVGSAGNVATSVTMSGDATIVASGALTIANSAVSAAKIATDAVTLSKLASTGQIYSYATTTATAANTTETTLASFALTSAIVDADGDVLDIYAYGSFGATANNKSVRLRLGATLGTATQLCVNTTTAAPNGINWMIKARIFRTGAASQKGQAEILFSGIASELDNFTATETWATSSIFLSGQNGTAAANDIVLEGFEVKVGRTNNN